MEEADASPGASDTAQRTTYCKTMHAADCNNKDIIHFYVVLSSLFLSSDTMRLPQGSCSWRSASLRLSSSAASSPARGASLEGCAASIDTAPDASTGNDVPDMIGTKPKPDWAACTGKQMRCLTPPEGVVSHHLLRSHRHVLRCRLWGIFPRWLCFCLSWCSVPR